MGVRRGGRWGLREGLGRWGGAWGVPGGAGAGRTTEHELGPGAAENVLRYLADQELATVVVPDDRNIVVERVRDELGDWRVCVLTPFGSRIHAPGAMAVTAKL